MTGSQMPFDDGYGVQVTCDAPFRMVIAAEMDLVPSVTEVAVTVAVLPTGTVAGAW